MVLLVNCDYISKIFMEEVIYNFKGVVIIFIIVENKFGFFCFDM